MERVIAFVNDSAKRFLISNRLRHFVANLSHSIHISFNLSLLWQITTREPGLFLKSACLVFVGIGISSDTCERCVIKLFLCCAHTRNLIYVYKLAARSFKQLKHNFFYLMKRETNIKMILSLLINIKNNICITLRKDVVGFSLN